jgi:diadenosine tetraphosphate (Ap4A) HIT family hydrolase
MPESASEIHRRSADALRMPPVQEWPSFPFDGDMRPRALRPPEDEPALEGEGGVDCRACTLPDEEYLWTDERWRLSAFEPSGLPVVVILEPREHHAAPGDLPDDLARECGVLLGRLERAVRSLDGIARVHVCRWGEGAEHLHWWFMGRPAGLTQLMSSFAAIWDDVLPPTPEDVWRDNLARVVEHLRDGQR